jgi:phage gp29-like protein
MARAQAVTTRIIDLNNFRSLVSYIDDTQDWLASVGESQAVFTAMMDDSRVESLVNNRKDRVLQMQGSFSGDEVSPSVMGACRTILDFNLFQRVNRILLNAVPYGLALCEVVWEKKDGLLVPVDFVPIPRTAISFPQYAEYGVPWLTTQNRPLSDPRKFLIHRNDAGDGNVWGRPALRSSYWPWKFKRLGFKFWIMAAERIGVPSILAIFEARTDKDAQARARVLSDLMAELSSGSSGAVGNVKDIKVVESAIADFAAIAETCNAEIAYGLTGQTLTTNQAQYGTKSQGVLHEGTYQSTTFADAYLLQETDQRLVNWFVDLNFPGSAAPKYDIDSTDYAEWGIVRDAIDRGVPVSLSALYEKTHIPKPKTPDDSFLKPASAPLGPAFSDPDRDSFFFQRARR